MTTHPTPQANLDKRLAALTWEKTISLSERKAICEFSAKVPIALAYTQWDAMLGAAHFALLPFVREHYDTTERFHGEEADQ